MESRAVYVDLTGMLVSQLNDVALRMPDDDTAAMLESLADTIDHRTEVAFDPVMELTLTKEQWAFLDSMKEGGQS